MLKSKLLLLPNGIEISSARIDRVEVFPDLSLALTLPYVRVFSDGSLIYEGLLDVDAMSSHQSQSVRQILAGKRPSAERLTTCER
jgi:hypothetical protein